MSASRTTGLKNQREIVAKLPQPSDDTSTVDHAMLLCVRRMHQELSKFSCKGLANRLQL